MAETAAAFHRIKEQISLIDGDIANIASKSLDQSTTLKEASIALSNIDQTTQQNAAMVEESTAACRSLADESERLAHMVAAFALTVGADEQSRRTPTPFKRPLRGLSPNPLSPDTAPCPHITPPREPNRPGRRRPPRT